MARDFFGVEKGFRISLENSDTNVEWLVGTGAPLGTGDQAAAAIGSIYQRIGTGELYQKKTNVGDATDWVIFATGSTVTRWRTELVDIITDDTISVGTRDVVASPLSDDDDGLTGADFVVGHYVISDADGTPTLLEITNVSGDDVTFAAATALVDGDAFIVDKYLPDPAGQENKALVVFSDGIMVKLSDIDWNFATGINLSSGFTKVNGTVTSSDTVETAIEKLAANQEDITTLTGVAQGSTDLGTFTGATIADGRTIKEALQDLETAYEETDQNVDDLITLSGVAENSTDLGTFTGDIIQDNQTVKDALQDLDTEVTRQRGQASASGVTTSTVVDSVLVDNVASVVWHVVIEQAASPENKRSLIVHAFHNGTTSADANDVDDTTYASLKTGSNFNRSVTIDLNGAGGAQVMRLSVASTEPSGVNVYVKRIETLF